ncbi:MDR family MFS transporter [Tomitella cavernea]|uniref:Major facilitator superfamily (MFS) profile domain-containing protein n=1 Tax=Tomitella cavernea TaxID=1387982 RepID=A0ABP9D0M8_9ACTN|nr:MDR family MFS transporter [Tomitella cavernea]
MSTTETPRNAPPGAPAAGTAPMSHREVLLALSGLLMAMFVAMLSSTVVSTALPRIVADLGGSEAGYTWVVTASLLTMTATTPIWGKFADLFSKKALTQLALLIYVAGSIVAGLADGIGVLIVARLIQGVGMGGLSALVQIVIASMITARDRGKYFGYLGAVFAVATVSGPLLGGLLVDATALGDALPGYMSGAAWRWCFYVGVPFAVIAFAVLQKTLHLPTVKRDVSIDYVGATLITAGVSVLLVWVSLGGSQFDWGSALSIGMLVGGLALLALFVWAETRVREPIIPLHLFKDRTTSLAVFASVMVGVAMFAGTVFLVQYFQLSRGMSPTKAGLMTLFLVCGVLVSSVVSGRLIAAKGKWKRFLIFGSVLLVSGAALLSTITSTTPIIVVGLYMSILGIGVGCLNQNLVLAVQNNAAQKDIGSASSLAAFMRTMGGAIGVSALGTALGHKVAASISGAAHSDPEVGRAMMDMDTHQIPDVTTLGDVLRPVYEHAYGSGVAQVFLFSVPFAVLAFLAVLFIKEVPLRETIERDDELADLQRTAAGQDDGGDAAAQDDAGTAPGVKVG